MRWTIIAACLTSSLFASSTHAEDSKEDSSNIIPPAICSYDQWTVKGDDVVQARKNLVKHLQSQAVKFDESRIYCQSYCFVLNTPCTEDYKPTHCVYKDLSFVDVNECNADQSLQIDFCRGNEKFIDRNQIECASGENSNPKIESILKKAENLKQDKKFELLIKYLSPLRVEGLVMPVRANAYRHFLLGFSYGELKQYDKAIEHIKKADLRESQLYLAEHNIASYTAQKGNTQGALWILNKLYNGHPHPQERKNILTKIVTDPDLENVRGLNDFAILKRKFEWPPTLCWSEKWISKGRDVREAKNAHAKLLSPLESKEIDRKVFCEPAQIRKACQADYSPTICVNNELEGFDLSECEARQALEFEFSLGIGSTLDTSLTECTTDDQYGSQNKQKIEAVFQKAEELTAKGQFAEVVKLLSTAKLAGQLVPPKVSAQRHLLLGNAYGQLKEYLKAIEHNRKARRFDSSLFLADYNNAVLIALLGDSQEALMAIHELARTIVFDEKKKTAEAASTILKKMQTEPALKSVRELKYFKDVKTRFEELSRSKTTGN